MDRFRNVNGVRVPFTHQENVARDLEEAYHTSSEKKEKDKKERKDRHEKMFDRDGVEKALFELMWDQENRIRALEGEQPINKRKYKKQLKALL